MTAAAYVDDRLQTFVPENYAWSVGAGRNVISGRAFSDASTGVAGACVGVATLLPDGPYVRFHNPVTVETYVGDPGDHGLEWRDGVLPPPAQYLIRHAPCGEDGHFEFRGVPDGSYILFLPLPRAQRYARKSVIVRGAEHRKLEIAHSCVTVPRPKWGDTLKVCSIAPVHPRIPPNDPNF
jgi:hypothetical protein